MMPAELSSFRRHGDPRSVIVVGIVALAVAFLDAPVSGGVLRFVAGIFSAWVLVTASSWCLAELARLHAVRLGAWIYTGIGIGIGIGIGVAGMLAWLGGLQPARLLWLELGLLAAVGTAYVVGITSSGGDADDLGARGVGGPGRRNLDGRYDGWPATRSRTRPWGPHTAASAHDRSLRHGPGRRAGRHAIACGPVLGRTGRDDHHECRRCIAAGVHRDLALA